MVLGTFPTSTLFHSGISQKKAALIQLTGHNLSGVEADRLGLGSMAVEAAELEAVTRPSGPCRRLFGFAKRRPPKPDTGGPTFDS